MSAPAKVRNRAKSSAIRMKTEMDYDFGSQLEKMRTARGLSIEQAAAAVRIRSTFLRALENSDLTKFPNAAYAKSFLLMYSRFLGVDLKSVASQIDTTTQMKVEGYQYLTNRAAEQPKSKQEPEPTFSMAPTPRSSGSWLPLLVLGGIVVVVGVAFVVWSNVNRMGDSQPEAPKPGVTRPGDEAAVQPLATSPTPPVPAPTPKPIPAPNESSTRPPEAEPPRPVVLSFPKSAAVPDAAASAAGEPGIPRARPVSPVGRIAAADTDALADLGAPKPVTRPLAGSTLAPVNGSIPSDEETTALAGDPNTIILEPRRKTWVIVRNAPGGPPVFEDYLYPTAKPLRLPAGRYFIELKDAGAVDISRDGKRIAYTAPGLVIQ